MNRGLAVLCLIFMSLSFGFPAVMDAQETSWLNCNVVMKKFNAPLHYYPNKRKGYSVAEVKFPVENGKKVWHISNVKGSGACRFDNYTRHPVLAGDRFIVSVQVRGKGKLNVCAQVYSQKKWMGYLGDQYVPVKAQWQTLEIPFEVKDLAMNYPTSHAFICVGATKGSELFIRSITVKRIAQIAGSVPFPNVWNAFLPMDLKYKPTMKELTSIPRTLNGVKPRKVQFNSSEHDFKAEFGSRRGTLDKHGSGNCVWLFAKIQAPKAEEYMIGAGADWWMTIYVNGKAVIDTSKNGNDHHPPRITDHKASFRLKKGENIIAVKYITGAGSMVLALGGPDQLRFLSRKLRIVDVLAKDNFEQVKRVRSGNVKVIDGKYSFALVNPSRQGLYQASGREEFDFGRKKFVMPRIVTGKHFAFSFRLVDLTPEGSFSFHGKAAKNPGNTLRVSFIRKSADPKQMFITLQEKGKTIASHSYPLAKLPCDVLFTADALGNYRITLETLVDSSVQCFQGKSPFFASLNEGEILFNSSLQGVNGKKAVLTLDNILIGYAMPEQIRKQIELDVNVAKTFDPVKAKWPLVFEDEFNGPEIDSSKWELNAPKGSVKFRNGIMEMTAVPMERKGKVSYVGVGLTSRKFYGYGYYEARVRFRRCDKWITAFWLYGGQTGNSFLDGMEIDVYEDYYVTKDRPVLDFNFHGFVGRVMKSWNYVGKIPGSLEDFYRIGVKWTPFELTYYLNGKAIVSQANHSPHKTVTYDALNHRIGIAPLRMTFKAVPISRGNSYPKGTVLPPFPDTSKLDYIRYYAMPTDKIPEVRLVKEDKEIMINRGESFTMECKVRPNAKTKARIKGVYLFDSGCLIDYKTKPPYKFTVTLNEKYYSGSVYMRPGRSREEPWIYDVLHAYSIFVQDANGEVAHTPVVMKMTRPLKASKPYKGQYQVIPGKVNPCLYDEGGNQVAYLDDGKNVMSKTFRTNEGVDCGPSMIGHVITGEWQNLSVDVKKSAFYNVSVEYGAPVGFGGSLLLIRNEKEWIGTLDLPAGNLRGWGGLRSKPVKVYLPAGKQTLKVLCVGAFNYSYLTFTPVK